MTISLSIIIVSLSLPFLASTAEYKLGVKDGDWVKYGIYTVSWSGNGTDPAPVVVGKSVQWLRVDFENVSGSTVLVNVTVQYKNGTQVFNVVPEDISGNSVMGGSVFLIASNLNSGDPITNQSSALTINQTTTERYVGALRNVNILEATSTLLNQTITSNVTYDQNTGVMVEMDSNTPYPPNPSGYIMISAKATETNLWSPDLVGTLSDSLVYIVIGIAIALIVITVATAAVLRRKKARNT